MAAGIKAASSAKALPENLNLVESFDINEPEEDSLFAKIRQQQERRSLAEHISAFQVKDTFPKKRQSIFEKQETIPNIFENKNTLHIKKSLGTLYLKT